MHFMLKQTNDFFYNSHTDRPTHRHSAVVLTPHVYALFGQAGVILEILCVNFAVVANFHLPNR